MERDLAVVVVQAPQPLDDPPILSQPVCVRQTPPHGARIAHGSRRIGTRHMVPKGQRMRRPQRSLVGALHAPPSVSLRQQSDLTGQAHVLGPIDGVIGGRSHAEPENREESVHGPALCKFWTNSLRAIGP